MNRRGLISTVISSMVLFFVFLYFLDALIQQLWYIAVSIVVILLSYIALTKLALNFFPKRSQAFALVLIVLALPVLGYAIFGVKIPQTFQYKTVDVGLICQDGTPVTFSLALNFSAEGVFSAENRIHVRAVISHANISDLTNHMAAISFTNAYSPDKVVIVENSPSYGYVTLHPEGNGQYIADGDLIWHQSETCYIIPVPPIPQGQAIKSLNFDETQLGGNPVLYVSPVSDTLSFKSNHTMEQLTYVAIAFTVIMLQPIISILYPNVDDDNPSAPSQTTPHYKQRKRKR